MGDTTFWPYAHKSHPCFWGILIYAHSQTWYHLEAIDITFHICAHAFLPFLWGTRAWIHSKTYINTMHIKQSLQSMSYKLVRYHYTYAPRPIQGNIGILIRLTQSIHPSWCYAYFCFVSRFCPIGYNSLNVHILSIKVNINIMPYSVLILSFYN